jgi:predicted secreted protein
VVFGFNKGSQIFEARSLDERLSVVTQGKAMEILGSPMFTATSDQHQILGYMAGTAYELVLYFAENTAHPEAAVLEHYEVLYPRGTANLMADDPGRDWSVLNAGDPFSVNLKGNPTTGYSWYFTVSDANVVKTTTESSIPDSDMMGAGSTFTWNFTAGTAGNAAITFKYYRVWEGEASTLPDNIRTFNMSVR